MRYSTLKSQDASVYKFIKNEEIRQITGIELIASENYVSESVLEAMGSILTNKYSEGYPDKRYYGGNKEIDKIEKIAIQRAKKLFNCNYHVNVQPYSGSPANLAVHFALLEPKDRTMGMSLSAGGHLTHGHKVSFSGTYYRSQGYGVEDNGFLDYEQISKSIRSYKPKLIWVGASAYPRIIDFEKFKAIAESVDAVMAVDMAHIAGLVATGDHPSPFPYADIVTTTTHKTLRGPRGAMIFCKDKYKKKIDKAVFPGLQGGPHNHITAGIAVALKENKQESFKTYSKQVIKNAQRLAKNFLDLGYPVASGGTDNHLLLLDVTNKSGMTGKKAETLLEKANVTVNKNMIPNDSRKPWDPSGIRIGTPAITTRGLKENDMDFIANIVDRVITANNKKEVQQYRNKVKTYMQNFPIPGIES
jgi:glycine hydroxymethyltransferase